MSAIPQHDPSILLREDRGGVCTLTMNRPRQMNLLTSEMLEALQKAFDSLMDDGSIRVIILAAATDSVDPAAFTARATFLADHDFTTHIAQAESAFAGADAGNCAAVPTTAR